MEATTSVAMLSDNQMCVTVEGEEISPEEYRNDEGWTLAGERMSRLRRRSPNNDETPDQGLRKVSTSTRQGKNFRTTVIKAARMPIMPREECKVVVRPRGGLDIIKAGTTNVADAILRAAGISNEESAGDTICPNVQQNILVVSTPSEANATKYARIQAIRVHDKVHEVGAYRTAPYDTVKGVIRGVPLSDSALVIDRNIVNNRNPLAVGTKRIGETTTVIVAFQGLKVPNFVRYGVTLIPCHLYRKQIDICQQCGKVGHRKDVCPTPTAKTCLACGETNPKKEHTCTPKCKLCTGAHPTGDRACKAKYKTPYIVRRRQWTRRQAEQQLSNADFPPLGQVQVQRTPRSHSRNRSLSKTRDASRCSKNNRSPSRDIKSISRKRSPSHERVSWADAMKENKENKTSAHVSVPRNDEAMESLRRENIALKVSLNNLEKENTELKTSIENLTKEMANIRALLTTQPSQLSSDSAQMNNEPMDTAKTQGESDRPVKEPAIKKRAVESHSSRDKKNKHVDELEARMDHIEARWEARFNKLEELMGSCIPALQQIELTLRPIVSHPTFAPLFAQHPYNQGNQQLLNLNQTWPPTHQQQPQV